MSFKKVVENFLCEYCGSDVVGNGFTDHCPRCLWSKHVDIDPGDRASGCGGAMEPVDTSIEKGNYRIVSRCEKCGFQRISPVVKDDDFEKVVSVAKKAAAKRENLLR
jgi:hypothetical protein